MDNSMNRDTNLVTLTGIAVSNLNHNHTAYGEEFSVFHLRILRDSGNEDILPIMVSNRLYDPKEDIQGRFYRINGQLRSYNFRLDNGKSKLILSVFATEIEEVEEDRSCLNVISLKGTICKQPIYRTTPLGREITDFIIAVNRLSVRADYIPCICWGRNAKFAETLSVGTKIRIDGRVQSRTYSKLLEDGSKEERTAYEVSIKSLREEA